jgi:hypothetical protein
MFVAGQIELPYVITLRLFIILSPRISNKKKKKTSITHLDITLSTTKWLTDFNSYKWKKFDLVKFLCFCSEWLSSLRIGGEYRDENVRNCLIPTESNNAFLFYMYTVFQPDRVKDACWLHNLKHYLKTWLQVDLLTDSLIPYNRSMYEMQLRLQSNDIYRIYLCVHTFILICLLFNNIATRWN